MRRWSLGAPSILVLLAASLLRAQAPAAQPQRPAAGTARSATPSGPDAGISDQVFKDVQFLKGIPVDEFMDTMGMIAASLGMNCTDCHHSDSPAGWAGFADATPMKTTARKMMQMVAGINAASFKGASVVTCYTCHRGDQIPKVVPSLAIQYGEPTVDPDEIDVAVDRSAPSVDQIFSKYIDAIGGPERVGGMTSYVANGTYEGYDTDHMKVPVEIYAKAPSQRMSTVHAAWGDNVRTYDGTNGWVSSADKPMPLMGLTGGNLTGARTDAILTFPSRIKAAFSRWKVGTTEIDDMDVSVVQASNTGQPPVNLYFDTKSGLLVRVVRWATTPIGTVPTKMDFSDYRDAAGVKVPFKIITTWTDGQTTMEFEKVQLNVAIDAAKFAKPMPAPPLKIQ